MYLAVAAHYFQHQFISILALSTAPSGGITPPGGVDVRFQVALCHQTIPAELKVSGPETLFDVSFFRIFLLLFLIFLSARSDGDAQVHQERQAGLR